MGEPFKPARRRAGKPATLPAETGGAYSMLICETANKSPIGFPGEKQDTSCGGVPGKCETCAVAAVL